MTADATKTSTTVAMRRPDGTKSRLRRMANNTLFGFGPHNGEAVLASTPVELKVVMAQQKWTCPAAACQLRVAMLIRSLIVP